MEQRRRMIALVYSVIGACIGLALLAPQAAIALSLPHTSLLKKAVLVLNWPPTAFLEWYAEAFEHGNTDHMLGLWLLAIPLYWLFVGSLVGLICYWLVRRRKDHHVSS